MTMTRQRNTKVEAMVRRLATKTAGVDGGEWLRLITTFIEKISVKQDELDAAASVYEDIGNRVDDRLKASSSTSIYPQGSVELDTAIRSHGLEYFDVDAVCEIKLPVGKSLKDAFEEVGQILDKTPGVSKVTKKKRCWQVSFTKTYKGKEVKFTLDMTPAELDKIKGGTNIRVYNSHLEYPTAINPSPSNPKGYAAFFKEKAAIKPRFAIVEEQRVTASVQPLAPQSVRPDILRSSIKLMKYHRDKYYRENIKLNADYKPISIIISTLAAQAYALLAGSTTINTPMELLLAVVDKMQDVPRDHQGNYLVQNPTNPSENFADKWPQDNRARETHFFNWIDQLQSDLEMLFNKAANVDDIRRAFGVLGEEAWKQAFTPSASQILRSFAPSAVTGVPKTPKTGQTLA